MAIVVRDPKSGKVLNVSQDVPSSVVGKTVSKEQAQAISRGEFTETSSGGVAVKSSGGGTTVYSKEEPVTKADVQAQQQRAEIQQDLIEKGQIQQRTVRTASNQFTEVIPKRTYTTSNGVVSVTEEKNIYAKQTPVYTSFGTINKQSVLPLKPIVETEKVDTTDSLQKIVFGTDFGFKKQAQNVRNLNQEFASRGLGERILVKTASTILDKPVSAGVTAGAVAFVGPVAFVKSVAGATAITTASLYFPGSKLSEYTFGRTKTVIEKPFIRSEEAQSIKRSAYAKETEAQSTVGQVLSGVSQAFSGKKEVYAEAIEEELKLRGYSEDETESKKQALLTQRRFASAGEIASLVYVSISSELIGRAKTAYLTRKEATFTTLFPKIAKPGFVEGFSQDIAQSISRSEPVNIGTASISGGLGFVSAGLVGGLIGATGTPGKFRSALETFSYTTDPYEAIGDYLASGVSRGGFRPQVFTFAPVNVASETAIKTPVKVPVNVPTSISENIFTSTDTSTPVKVGTEVSSFTITPVPVPVSTSTNILTSTSTSTNVLTNVPIQTNTNVLTNTNVPVFTPNIKLPPLPIISLGGFGGIRRQSKVGRGRQRKLYTPTLTSAIFGLKRRSKNDKLGVTTGLGLRGI